MFYECGSSKGNLDIQDNYKFKKRVFNKVPTNFSKPMMIWCLNVSLKREDVLAHQARSQIVEKCCKNQYCYCLVAMDNCFGCIKVAIR